MKPIKLIVLFFTHSAALIIGFAAGIYLLPILIAPPAPTQSEIETVSKVSEYTGEFSRDRQDSDALHWGEGRVSVSATHIAFMGKLAPGPDYKLYLSPEFVETEAQFEQLKSTMTQIGDIKTFKNFLIEVPESIDVDEYTTVIVWCERFGEFITSALYR